MRAVAFKPVSEVMTPSPIIVSSSEVVSKLLGRLYETDTYEAVVVGGNSVGLITVRDLLDVTHPERTAVERVTKTAATIRPEAMTLEAVDLMISHRLRAIPIADETGVIGLISQVEVTESLSTSPDLKEIRCKEVMVSPVITANANDSVASARRLMLKHGISHIPIVTAHGKLMGVVTAKTVVHTFVRPMESVSLGERVGETIQAWEAPAKSIMDSRPLSVEPNGSTFGAVHGLRRLRKSACLVVEDEQPVGIITPREVMSLLLRFKEREELPVYILGLDEPWDFFEVETVKSKVMRVMSRHRQIHPDIEEAIIHVRPIRKMGQRAFYQLNARVYSPTEHLIASGRGWDLPSAFDTLCDRLDRRLRGAKITYKVRRKR